MKNKLEKYLINIGTIPALLGSIILGATIDDMDFVHFIAMILLIMGGLFMGIGLKTNKQEEFK